MFPNGYKILCNDIKYLNVLIQFACNLRENSIKYRSFAVSKKFYAKNWM